MLGILLIDKPKGPTSHDAVYAVRRRLSIKRVGHAGTLDPNASGLLVVAVGPATRFLQYLPLEPKEYIGTFRFGQETVTQDVEGEVCAEAPLPDDLRAAIEAALPAFLGPIEQIPPMYSAIKKAGQPLYTYARKGEEVEREPRAVTIERFELRSCEPPLAEFRVICSGGTYVRTLAHDLGRAIGCGAHLAELTRTHVGPFSLEQAAPLDQFSPDDLVPLADALSPMPVARLSQEDVAIVRNGGAVPAPEAPGPFLALAEPEGEVFAIARLEGNLAQPECVIPYEAMHGAI